MVFFTWRCQLSFDLWFWILATLWYLSLFFLYAEHNCVYIFFTPSMCFLIMIFFPICKICTWIRLELCFFFQDNQCIFRVDTNLPCQLPKCLPCEKVDSINEDEKNIISEIITSGLDSLIRFQVEFVKCIPGFKELCLADQSELLKGMLMKSLQGCWVPNFLNRKSRSQNYKTIADVNGLP